MKKHAFVILLISYTTALLAQNLSRLPGKLPVDTAAFFNWPAIQDWPRPAISNDGKYALYSIQHIPVGSNTMMIQALNSNWKIALPGIGAAAFTDDSRRIVFMQPNDTLCILTLSTEEKIYIPGVKSFQLFMQASIEWLACQMTDQALMLRDLTSGTPTTYKNVDHYVLSQDGKTMVLQTMPDISNGKSISIQWLHLATNTIKEIWKGKNVSSLLLDGTGKQLAFLVQDSTTAKKTIWLYKAGEEDAVELLNDQSTGIVENMQLDAIADFSKDGSKLFIQLKQKPLRKQVPDIVPVNIWSYTDAKLQSQQLTDELNLGKPSYLAVVDLQAPLNIRRIQQENETIEGSRTDDIMLLVFRKGETSEHYWNKAAACSTYLVTVGNGKKIPIPVSGAIISPGKKYIAGYGTDEIWGGDLYIYEMATGITRNITANIPIPLQDEENDILLTNNSRGLRLAGWLSEDAALLVYDNYDIWQVDPSGKKTPVNLTNGRSKKCQFRLASEDILGGKVTQPGDLLLLTVFNKTTKQHGFYQLKLGNTKDPALLCIGNYVFGTFWTSDNKSPFLKARDTNVYLVKREQTDQSPNIFSTIDFKRFTPISNIYPEKVVNWFTSSLISFNTPDRIQTQAILYKPENFNPLKKYPLIIHYYDKKSDALNQYRYPVVDNGGELDVAWFTSHGYLVLLTDIHYKIGETGESVYKAVVSAAEYLSQCPYVDKSHIGIQGHSFGGYATNYLVTHSDLFAAAVSSSGISDVISDYGNLWPGDNSRQEYWEMRNGRMGTTPWGKPDIYVKNSPIFYVGRMKTPILMVQNKNDKNVHFEQGLEFFTALRRAGKRAWMLEYDNGGHGVWGEEYKDYLLRMTQFFNHYLKGAPAPKWMTRGIPAIMKGVDDGLEFDDEMKTPGEGLLKKPSH